MCIHDSTEVPHRRLSVARPAFSAAFLANIMAIFLGGCAIAGSDYRPPDTVVPPHWQGPAAPGARDAATLADWWRRFNDPVLDDLIQKALAASTDLKTAQARLREVRARRDLASANLGPTVTASATASRSKSGGEAAHEQYQGGVDAGWEPDLFGGVRQGVRAADADVQANLESLRDVRVSLISEVALNYTGLRTSEKRLAIAEENLAAQQELYELTRWRRQAGLVSDLDEAQALTLLQQSRASLPSLRTAVVEARHRLDILLALPPGELERTLRSTGNIPVADDKVAVGIPAATLRQRPDVRAAERRLAAQAARLGEARAARYPSLRLTGSLGLRAASLSGLGEAAATNSLLAGITAPIFDSGRIRSNIEIQDAVLEQDRLAYQGSVLVALQEVENALVSVSNSSRRQAELIRAAASAGQALELARQQYSVGLADFQTVLDSQRTVLNLDDQLATSEGDHSTALIQLYKALGGGWTPQSPSGGGGQSS